MIVPCAMMSPRDGIVQSDLIGLPVIVQPGRLPVDAEGRRMRCPRCEKLWR